MNVSLAAAHVTSVDCGHPTMAPFYDDDAATKKGTKIITRCCGDLPSRGEGGGLKGGYDSLTSLGHQSESGGPSSQDRYEEREDQIMGKLL